MSEATYSIEYAKSGRSTCKGTKEKIEKGALRLAKITIMQRNEEDISMAAWYLPVPFFQMMKRMRKGSKYVESTADLAGFDDLKEEDQATVRKMIADYYDEDVDFPPKPPKKEKKRPSTEEGGEAAPAPAEKKAKAPPPGDEIPPETRADVTQPMLRDIADELAERLRAAGYNVPDAAAARQQIGPLCMGALADGTLDVQAALRQGAKMWGRKVVVETTNAGNAALAAAFAELSSYEYKMGERMKGTAYKKVSVALAEHDAVITSGKEATKLKGIGKSSAEKIDQFLSTGTIAKLEEYKNQA